MNTGIFKYTSAKGTTRTKKNLTRNPLQNVPLALNHHCVKSLIPNFALLHSGLLQNVPLVLGWMSED